MLTQVLPQRYIHTHFHWSIILNDQEMEQTLQSTKVHTYMHTYTHKRNTIHSLKNKEILSFVTTQEPEGHYANINKIDIESQLLHDLTYSIWKVKFIETESRIGVYRYGDGRKKVGVGQRTKSFS
jgi:hypothetical protein